MTWTWGFLWTITVNLHPEVPLDPLIVLDYVLFFSLFHICSFLMTLLINKIINSRAIISEYWLLTEMDFFSDMYRIWIQLPMEAWEQHSKTEMSHLLYSVCNNSGIIYCMVSELSLCLVLYIRYQLFDSFFIFQLIFLFSNLGETLLALNLSG